MEDRRVTPLSYCQRLRARVPPDLRLEISLLLTMTGPLLLSRVLNFMLPFVVTVFCGRLETQVMAGYGLASAAINCSVAAAGYGLGQACDTLVTQTFGSRNLPRVGVVLQRGILILLLFCLPCWGLLVNMQPILLALGQGPELARIVQVYVYAFMPALPAVFLHHIHVTYLQSQGIIMPQVYMAVLANVANIITNYVLLNWLALGLSGSAAANSLAQIYQCSFMFAYTWWNKLHVSTWKGWSTESLQEWGSFMRLAIPSTLMTCFEWWIYESGGFLAGLLGENELAAQHVIMMVAFINYMIPLGIQAAACVRVGTALGAGDTAGAILSSKVALSLAGALAVVECLVLASTRSVIGLIFTSDQTVVALVSRLLSVYCMVPLFDGLVCVSTGILLGTGRQKIAAVANLLGYYGIGLPLAATLMFVAELRGLGFWLGLLVAVCLQSIFYVVVILNFNWEKMTVEAVKRGKKNMLVEPQNPETCNSNSTGSPVNRLLVEDQKQPGEGPPAQRSGAAQGAAQGPRRGLSTTQLVLRRGFTTVLMALLLVAGVVVHYQVPLPESPASASPESNRTLGWANVTDTAPAPGLPATWVSPG